MVNFLCYSLAVYGLCVLLIEGFGPWDILEKFRQFTKKVYEPLGKMFDCFLCTSTNLGWIVAVLEYCLEFQFSPVSSVMSNAPFIVYVFANMFFTCGVVWVIRNIVSYYENKINVIDGDDD